MRFILLSNFLFHNNIIHDAYNSIVYTLGCRRYQVLKVFSPLYPIPSSLFRLPIEWKKNVFKPEPKAGTSISVQNPSFELMIACITMFTNINSVRHIFMSTNKGHFNPPPPIKNKNIKKIFLYVLHLFIVYIYVAYIEFFSVFPFFLFLPLTCLI